MKKLVLNSEAGSKDLSTGISTQLTFKEMFGAR